MSTTSRRNHRKLLETDTNQTLSEMTLFFLTKKAHMAHFAV